MGGEDDGSIHAEETVCHRFAGHLLVPDELLGEVVRSARVVGCETLHSVS
jgi:hypothetical protein